MCNLWIDSRDTDPFLKPWCGQGTNILCSVIASQYLPLLPPATSCPTACPVAELLWNTSQACRKRGRIHGHAGNTWGDPTESIYLLTHLILQYYFCFQNVHVEWKGSESPVKLTTCYGGQIWDPKGFSDSSKSPSQSERNRTRIPFKDSLHNPLLETSILVKHQHWGPCGYYWKKESCKR